MKIKDILRKLLRLGVAKKQITDFDKEETPEEQKVTRAIAKKISEDARKHRLSISDD